MGKRRYERKPHHLTRPRILSFIAYTFMLFFGATILVNINPDANYDYHRQWAQRKGLEMQWVFVDDAGQKYDLDAPIIGSEHGAAQTYDYLLPSSGASSTKIDQKSDPNAQLPDDGAKRVIRGYQYLSEDIEDRRGFINAVYTYLVSGKLTALPEGSVRYVVAMYGLDGDQQDQIFEYQSCMSPWGYEMEHGASVLAYQQRSDAPNVCNIQRRSCFNGKLSGSFTQRACDENINGNLTTSNFISKNLSLDQTALQGNVSQQEAKRDFLKEQGYIQPNKKAQNADSDFNLLGHLEPDPEPKTISLNGGDGIRDETEIPLPPKAKNACLTPRGEKVRQGQFVKAYRFQNGFTDLTCQAQIRLCADGELEGTYQYPSCKVRETSYQDFVHGYLDAQEPSPQRLLKMLEKNYEAEDAVLTPEVAREMKQMLEQEEK